MTSDQLQGFAGAYVVEGYPIMGRDKGQRQTLGNFQNYEQARECGQRHFKGGFYSRVHVVIREGDEMVKTGYPAIWGKRT